MPSQAGQQIFPMPLHVVQGVTVIFLRLLRPDAGCSFTTQPVFDPARDVLHFVHSA